MPKNIDKLIHQIKNISYDSVTLAFCEQIANDCCALSFDEFDQIVKGLTESEQTKYALFIVIGLRSYYKIQTMRSDHYLYKWLNNNSCLFIFLRSISQDQAQDPLMTLKELFDPKKFGFISSLYFEFYSIEKDILDKIKAVNLPFIMELKRCFNNVLQLYMYQNRYEEYLFDTYLPDRNLADDLNQNLVELALANSTAFCHFIRNEPLKAACFSGYDVIAARNPLVLYEIVLGLRDYTESITGPFSNLVKTGRFDLVYLVLGTCDPDITPGWMTGLTNKELISLYEQNASIFWAVRNKYPARLIVLLRDLDFIKKKPYLYTEIFNACVHSLSDADYFDAREAVSTSQEITQNISNLEEKSQIFNMYWLLRIGETSAGMQEILNQLAESVSTETLVGALTRIFAVRSYKNIDPRKLASYFPAQMNDILLGEDYYGSNDYNIKIEEMCGQWDVLVILIKEMNQRSPVPHFMLTKMLSTPLLAECLLANLSILHDNHFDFFTKLMRNNEFAEHAKVKAFLGEKTKRFTTSNVVHGQQRATLFMEQGPAIKQENMSCSSPTPSGNPPSQPSIVDSLVEEFEESLLESIEEEFEESLNIFPCSSSQQSIFQSGQQKIVLPKEGSCLSSRHGPGIGVRR